MIMPIKPAGAWNCIAYQIIWPKLRYRLCAGLFISELPLLLRRATIAARATPRKMPTMNEPALFANEVSTAELHFLPVCIGFLEIFEDSDMTLFHISTCMDGVITSAMFLNCP